MKKKNCKPAIMDFGRSEGAMGRNFFLVYPEGIKSIYAKFWLTTNFFQVTAQIYCTISRNSQANQKNDGQDTSFRLTAKS